MGYGGGPSGCQEGLGHPGDPSDQPHVPPQKHTDQLQAQAEASLLGLVCHLYQVGQGSGGGTAGLGDTSPSLVELSWLRSGRERSLKSVGAPRPRSSHLAAGAEGRCGSRERTIKRIFLLKTTRIWSGMVGETGRGWFCPPTVGRGEGLDTGADLQTQELPAPEGHKEAP